MACLRVAWVALALSVSAVPSASAQSETGYVWGITVGEIGTATSIATFLATKITGDAQAPYLVSTGLGTMGLAFLIGVLAEMGDWTRLPPRIAHMAFWFGFAAFGIATAIQVDVTPWSWGAGIVSAVLGGLVGGLFIDSQEEDEWAYLPALAFAGAGALVLVLTLLLYYNADDAISFLIGFPPTAAATMAIGVSVAAALSSPNRSVQVGPTSLRIDF